MKQRGSQRGAVKANTYDMWNHIMWRRHQIGELERQRTRSSMSGRSYK